MCIGTRAVSQPTEAPATPTALACPKCGKEPTQFGEYVYRHWTQYKLEGNKLTIYTSSDKINWEVTVPPPATTGEGNMGSVVCFCDPCNLDYRIPQGIEVDFE